MPHTARESVAGRGQIRSHYDVSGSDHADAIDAPILQRGRGRRDGGSGYPACMRATNVSVAWDLPYYRRWLPRGDYPTNRLRRAPRPLQLINPP